MQSVAIYEAKARFSELLAAVQAGDEVEITRHGKPIVRMVAVPTGEAEIEAEARKARVEAAFARLAELREGFVLEGDIKEIIAEGRM